MLSWKLAAEMSSKEPTSAAVETSDDPYKDIELYLEKAQEEIGQTFQNSGKASHSSGEQINPGRKAGEEEIDSSGNTNASTQLVTEKINGINKLVQLENILHELSHGFEDDVFDLDEGTNTNSELVEGQKKHLAQDVSPSLSAEQGINVAARITKLYNLPPLKQVEPDDPKIDGDEPEPVDDYSARLVTVISAGLSSSARRNKSLSSSKEVGKNQCPNNSTGSCSLEEQKQQKTSMSRTIPPTPVRKDSFKRKLAKKQASLLSSDEFVPNSRPSSNLDLNALSTWASIFAQEMTTIANENGFKSKSDDINNNENPCIIMSPISTNNEMKKEETRNVESFTAQSGNRETKSLPKENKNRKTNEIQERKNTDENKMYEGIDSLSSQMEIELLDEILQIIENNEIKFSRMDVSNEPLSIKEKNDLVAEATFLSNDPTHEGKILALSQPPCRKFTFKTKMTTDENRKSSAEKFEEFDLVANRSGKDDEKSTLLDTVDDNSSKRRNKVDKDRTENISVAPTKEKNRELEEEEEETRETGRGNNGNLLEEKLWNINDGLDGNNPSEFQIAADLSANNDSLTTDVHKRSEFAKKEKSEDSEIKPSANVPPKTEEKMRSLSASSPPPSSPNPVKPTDVQEFIKRVEKSILSLTKKSPNEDYSVEIALRNSLLLNSALCNKAVQHVSTQTSPLVSRSSSFLWISETDIAKQQNLLQSDAATCSVNSILSSCSSLEAFSEESLTENSTYSDSDSSSSTSGSKEHDKGDRMKINPDAEFFRALSGKRNHIDMSLMNEKLACSDFEEYPADECLLQFPIEDRMHTSRRKGSHSVIPENEEIFDFTSGSNMVSVDKASGKVHNKCGKSCSSSLPTRNNKNTPITLEETVRETHSETNIANARINSVLDNKAKECVTSDSFKEKETSLKPPHQLFQTPLKHLGSSAPNSPLSSPLEESPVTPASVSALSDTSTLPMLYITSKSSSAPMLDIQSHQQKTLGQNSQSAAHPPSAITLSSGEIDNSAKVIPPPRSQSVKELTELEAVEACKWLRAAGFPQYAQMFEDMQFPINITAVQKDHYFLDADSIQSLFRRLNALNRCARMRLDNIPRKSGVDDSDEEEQIALSENWTFQRQSRRWSRISMTLDSNSTTTNKNNILISSNHVNGQNHTADATNSHCEDTVAKSSPKMTAEFDIPESPIPMDEDGSGGSASLGSLSTSDKMEDSLSSERTGSFRRTSSERLRDGAKAFLRRMESLKTRRSKRRNREAVVISGPQVVDLEGMQRRMQNLACRDLTPPSSASPSPLLTHQRNLSNGHKNVFDDSSSMNSISDNSQTSTPTLQAKNYHWGIHTTVSDLESNAFSDSECSPPLWHSSRDANSNETKLIEHYLQPEEINCVPNGLANNSNHINFRTGSFNLGKESASYRQKFLERRRLKQNATLYAVDGSTGKRNSVYDNVPTSNKSQEGTGNCEHSNDINKKIDVKNCEEKSHLHLGFYQDSDSSNSASTNLDAETENRRIAKSENNCSEESNNSSARSQTQPLYNSNLNFQVNQQIQVPSLKRPRSNSSTQGLPLSRLSATQLMMVRKLSLLKLTALMERYSPSNRSGWSWIMPKFMKRMKTPDYKDKVMFGVPLTVVCQRTGEPLPPCIQTAIQYLRKNAMDSVGIFRKSGVRSRIQKLKNLCEANPHSMSYEGQQSYDVADMLKQYFRELPEALLTNKMSETFICIYQYIPEELRHEALKAAIMLMPDENREVLHKLLSFLHDVSLQSHENQMTGSNLAVCFAPSLFHMNTPRSSSSSPRRRKTVGVPDQKELNENKAAHECLTHMIKEYKKLFSVPEDTMFQCRVSLSDDEESVTLEDLGQLSGNLSSDWKSYINNSVENLLKEAKEKSKNWVSVMTTENAEIACKKIGDGNPLRLWKVSVEVEAPPIELLTRVLRERHIWDDQLTKWRVVSRLNNHSEIFQYVRNCMYPLPSRDYCILRSWRTDLPKGACVLVETSVNHPDAPLPPNDVRGFVYLSRYLIEPCGSGKSRITHISRIDTKGRSPEWYNKIYGHISALHLLKIGESFQHSTEGPESKV